MTEPNKVPEKSVEPKTNHDGRAAAHAESQQGGWLLMAFVSVVIIVAVAVRWLSTGSFGAAIDMGGLPGVILLALVMLWLGLIATPFAVARRPWPFPTGRGLAEKLTERRDRLVRQARDIPGDSKEAMALRDRLLAQAVANRERLEAMQKALSESRQNLSSDEEVSS